MIFVEYNNTYLEILEKYFKHSKTPANNSNHKIFKTHLYDRENGILGLLIDKDEIVAVSSAVKVVENNTVSCKYPHRLHVRSDYSWVTNKFVDQFWDPLLFDWLETKNIRNVYCTFNEGNHLAFFWAAIRHSRRLSHTTYINSFGKEVLNQEWYVYPFIINEMNTWQYLIYSSPDRNWFYPHREEKEMPEELISKLNSRFDFVSGFGWRI